MFSGRLRFHDLVDSFEMTILEQGAEGFSLPRDAVLSLQVSSSGFSGSNEFWVNGGDLRSFCTGLVCLERERRGTVELESESPDELNISVHAIDSWGHMAVQGSTGSHVECATSRHWHAVHFGFEFDPSQLLQAVAVDWVKHYAASPGSTPDGASP